MAYKLSDCTRTHYIRWGKNTEDKNWLLENISVSLSGSIAVSGRHYTTYLTSIGVYRRNSNSRDELKLCFDKVFEESETSERLVSFLEPETDEIVTCCGNRIEVISINYGPRSRCLLKDKVGCLFVRGTQIFVGFTEPKIFLYNRKLDPIKSISLEKIRNSFMPIDMAATVDKIFISTLSNQVAVGKINEATDTEFKTITEQSLIARSLTVSVKLELVAILWGNNKIGIYSVSGHSPLLMIASEDSISRIRISDSGKLATGNRNEGEVKLYEIGELFTYDQLKQHLITQIQTNDCKKMTEIFNLTKGWTDAITKSVSPTENLLFALEMEGIIYPNNVERVTEAFKEFNISYSYHLLELYQKTRKQPTSYGRFLATLSSHLCGRLTQELCKHFNISEEATSKILSTLNPGLSLLLTLDEFGIIVSSNVGVLEQLFTEMGLVQAVAKIHEYHDLTVEEKTLPQVDSEGKRRLIIRCLRNKIKYWYETMTPVPWKKSCRWKSTELFVSMGLILTDSKDKRSLPDIDEKCKLHYTGIIHNERLKAEKRIILEGEPGSGKTMVSSQLAYDWSQGKLNEVDVLFFLPLKFVKYMDLRESIKRFYFAAFDYVSVEDIECLMTDEDLRSCLILDGLEEYNCEERKTDAEPSEVAQVMEMSKYPNCKVILTSRTNYAKDFQICPMLKIGKFSEKEQNAYLEKVFPDDAHRQNMSRIIADIPFIQDFCNVPLLLVLTLHNLETMDWSIKGSHPNRVSPFLEEIVRLLCDPDRKEGASDEVGVIDDSTLSEFAYNGLCRGKQILSWHKNILESKISNVKQFLDAGILVVEEGIGNINANKLKEQPVQKTQKANKTKKEADVDVRANKHSTRVIDAIVPPLNQKYSLRKSKIENGTALKMTDDPVPKKGGILHSWNPFLFTKRKCPQNSERRNETDGSSRAGERYPVFKDSTLALPLDPDFPQSNSAYEAAFERSERQTSSSGSTAKYFPLEVKFLHKLIQEWFAAKYLSYLLRKSQNDNGCRKLLYHVLPQINPIDLQHILLFTSYLFPPSCHLIMDFLLQSHRTAEGDIPEYIMNCVCRCFTEYTGIMGSCMENTVSNVCAETILIRSGDRRLTQQSKVTLMTFAASVGIPIREVHLIDVVIQVSKEGLVTFNSGVALNIFNMIEGIEVSRWDQCLEECDYKNLVQHVLCSKSIRKARFHFPSQPPDVHRLKDKLGDEDVLDKRVEWLIGPKFVQTFNAETYQWEICFREPSTRLPCNNDIQTVFEEDIAARSITSSRQNTRETSSAKPFKQYALKQRTDDCTGSKRVRSESYQSPPNQGFSGEELAEPPLLSPQSNAELSAALPNSHTGRIAREHPANSGSVPDNINKTELQDRIPSARQYPYLQSLPGYGSNTAMLQQIFLGLSKAIGKEWRLLGLSFGLTSAEIYQNCDASGGCCREKIYYMLEYWQKKKGSEATVDVLITALESVDRKDLADDLRGAIVKAGDSRS